jgi:hypothetical protein
MGIYPDDFNAIFTLKVDHKSNVHISYPIPIKEGEYQQISAREERVKNLMREHGGVESMVLEKNAADLKIMMKEAFLQTMASLDEQQMPSSSGKTSISASLPRARGPFGCISLNMKEETSAVQKWQLTHNHVIVETKNEITPNIGCYSIIMPKIALPSCKQTYTVIGSVSFLFILIFAFYNLIIKRRNKERRKEKTKD